MEAQLPAFHDGDTVECVVNGETYEGVAILDAGNVVAGQTVLLVEVPGLGVVLPDPRFPVLLVRSAA
jgi:hypothetical protein